MTDQGARLRIIAGTAAGTDGPVTHISVDPLYVDVALTPGATHVQAVEAGHTCFAYVFEGSAAIGDKTIDLHTLAVLTDGDRVELSSDAGGRLIVVAGRPIEEPVARYGPFVMNTRDEIHQAIRDYQTGNF